MAQRYQIVCQKCGKRMFRDEAYLNQDYDSLNCTECGHGMQTANNQDYRDREEK